MDERSQRDSDVDVELHIIGDQIAQIGREMNEFLLASDKVFGLAITILVGGLTLGLGKKAPEAIVALPFALAGLLIYALQLFTERAARAGLKSWLEVRANKLIRQSLFLQERCISRIVSQRRVSVLFSTFLYALAYVISAIAGIEKARQIKVVLGRDLQWWVFAGVIILSCAIVVAGWELLGAEAKAYEAATSAAKDRFDEK